MVKRTYRKKAYKPRYKAARRSKPKVTKKAKRTVFTRKQLSQYIHLVNLKRGNTDDEQE